MKVILTNKTSIESWIEEKVSFYFSILGLLQSLFSIFVIFFVKDVISVHHWLNTYNKLFPLLYLKFTERDKKSCKCIDFSFVLEEFVEHRIFFLKRLCLSTWNMWVFSSETWALSLNLPVPLIVHLTESFKVASFDSQFFLFLTLDCKGGFSLIWEDFSWF